MSAIVGVISWSTGPNGSAGCGGLTGVTPLTLYRDWIVQTARQWGSALARMNFAELRTRETIISTRGSIAASDRSPGRPHA